MFVIHGPDRLFGETLAGCAEQVRGLTLFCLRKHGLKCLLGDVKMVRSLQHSMTVEEAGRRTLKGREKALEKNIQRITQTRVTEHRVHPLLCKTSPAS